MSKVDYDDRLYACYHSGRAHDESVMQMWRRTLRRIVGDRTGLTILDLGSGTGRFSSLLADEFAANVIGVEPSDRMREVAEAGCQHPHVRFLKGAAEFIPIPDAACDVVWISQVVHHVQDLDAAARELQRVLAKSGQAIFRSNFRGRLNGFCRYYDYFPEGLAVDEARHPTVEHVRDCCHRHGLQLAGFQTIEQQEARSLMEYADRIRRRTYSTFELISEEEYQAGLTALTEAAAKECVPRPVMAKVDVLVFAKSG